MSSSWNREKCETLELLLKEGFTVPKIAKQLNTTPGTIYRELKRTLTSEEYEEKRYIKYCAEKAIANRLKDFNGE